jgi:hypothetical protein
MATSMTTDFAIRISTPVASAARVRPNRLRRITPQAGHALEILGHAIEYLTDEFVHHGGEISAGNSQLEAVQLLMARNREIYYACPELVTMGDRLREMLHLRAA